jgi:antitoxin component of MazEF toxin-antitoxin module
MTVATIQKAIKIGTSAGITIPAKEWKRMGLEYGDEIKVTFEPIQKIDQEKVEFVALTQKLIKRHQKALNSLSQR